MKPIIKPITILRDTSKAESLAKESNEPIFITKNGHGDLVLMSQEYYEQHFLHTPPDKCPPNNSLPFGRRPYPLHDHPKEYYPYEYGDCLGFVRVMSAQIEVAVACIYKNVEAIKEKIKEASNKNVHILVFQELTITGYTCGDLFFDNSLLNEASKGIKELISFSKDYDLFISVGAPFDIQGNLYNCAFNIHKGELLGITPKTNLPSYDEFYEGRWFAPGDRGFCFVDFDNKKVPFGSELIYVDSSNPAIQIGVEICEDLWVNDSPSSHLADIGADIILNLSASNDVDGKAEFRKKLIVVTSSKTNSAYIYATAGKGESSTDLVFGGQGIVAENGHIIKESPLFAYKDVVTDIDLDELIAQRRKRVNSFKHPGHALFIPFDMKVDAPNKLERSYSKTPFILEGGSSNLNWVKSVLEMQVAGLSKRLDITNSNKVIIGISGGLDSALALIVASETFKKKGYDLTNIKAITLPSNATSSITRSNAEEFSIALGVEFKEIPIQDSMKQHFKDINLDENNRSATYENGQARERTQILMDLANKEGGIMMGTGDLSELCLGWTTYGGDHMSMYNVNVSIPKTMVKELVIGYGNIYPELSKWTSAIANTPISPELLPLKEGEIAQKTEEQIGPYILHDFFIYHYLKNGCSPKKLYFLATQVFEDEFSKEEIKKWLKVFFKRFFMSQFKRSCLPDGPKVTSISISPRGDLRMPSDGDSSDYLNQIDAL